MKTRTYITRTLSDILPGYDEFNSAIISKLNFTMTAAEKDYLFTLLYSRYADSHSRYTNESLFILNLKKEIMVHYPAVMAMIRDQKTLRDTTDKEFANAGRMILNVAGHNTANISTETREGIEQLDSQQIQNNERARIDVLFQRMDMYRSDMEDRFLNRFVRYFVQIIYPQRDLLYISAPGEEDLMNESGEE